MRRVIVGLFLLTAIVGATKRSVLFSRIIGGQYASPNQFPYQVGIRRYKVIPDKYNFCGGSLLSNEWVLSAASCTMWAFKVEVFLGDIHLEKGLAYMITPDDIINHRRFDAQTMENDISLIRIPYTFFSKSIQSIEVPSFDNKNKYVDATVTATGWGATGENPESSKLKYARFTVMSNEVCNHFIANIKDTQLCVGTSKFRSPSFGDTGGPLVFDSPKAKLQIGIVSFNTRDGIPFVFTRLSKYKRWLQRKTGIYDSERISKPFNETENILPNNL